MKYKIPFAKIETSLKEFEYVENVLKSGWLTTGSVAKEFEDNFCKFTGAKHALAVSSCTAALHLALNAISIKKGDKAHGLPYQKLKQPLISFPKCINPSN